MLLRALLLTCLLQAVCLGAPCSKVLRVPFESWPPYSYLDAGGKPAGFEIDMLDAIARAAGCKVSWVQDLPRKRRWLYFTQGELDVLLAASDNGLASHNAVAMFTRPYRPEIIAAFVLDDRRHRPHVGSLQAMLDHRVPLVTQTGSDGGYPLAAQFLAAGLVTRYEAYRKGVQLLQLRRGEVLIGDQWAVQHAATEQGVPIRRLDIAIARGEVAYMLNRKTLTLADLNVINEAIVQLGRDGTLERIRRRWLVGL
ncbi:substrate-binding periplasmic protein [Chitinimonas prasina]|nr:transporter substrate-binding domain-containing protein [Chitinimonas prasina]